MTMFKVFAWRAYNEGIDYIDYPDDYVTTVYTFVADVAKAAKNTVVEFVKGIWHHWESVSILILGSLGLDVLLGELPFWFELPMWIESSLVTPVIATMVILFLVWNADRRARKREGVLA